MNKKSNTYKIKLGIFVTLGFLLFMVLIFLIGRQRNIFNPVFEVYTAFHNVSGLEVGNNVRFSGINVGTVSDIEIFDDSSVIVTMILKKNVQAFIKTDCVVSIGSEGLIGDRTLNINHGSAHAASVSDNSMLLSVEPVETDEIITSLSVTAQNFEIITNQLAEITIRVNNGEGTLGRLIQDSVISENVSEMILNLKQSSHGLNENMEAAKSNFLLRGFFNKKEREAKKDSIQKARQDKRNNKRTD